MRLNLGDFFEYLVFFLLQFCLLIRIEVNHTYGLPVARGAAPALGVPSFRCFIDLDTLCVNGFQFPFKSGVGSLPVALTG